MQRLDGDGASNLDRQSCGAGKRCCHAHPPRHRLLLLAIATGAANGSGVCGTVVLSYLRTFVSTVCGHLACVVFLFSAEPYPTTRHAILRHMRGKIRSCSSSGARQSGAFESELFWIVRYGFAEGAAECGADGVVVVGTYSVSRGPWMARALGALLSRFPTPRLVGCQQSILQ